MPHMSNASAIIKTMAGKNKESNIPAPKQTAPTVTVVLPAHRQLMLFIIQPSVKNQVTV